MAQNKIKSRFSSVTPLLSIVLFLVSLVVVSYQQHTVFADNPDGCYNAGTVVSCNTSAGANDTDGNPLDPTNNCYSLISFEAQAGSSDSDWESVSCSDLTTHVMSTTASTSSTTNPSSSSSGSSCADPTGNTSTFCVSSTDSTKKYGCGSNDQEGGSQGLVDTTIDFGCKGNACAQGSTTGYCARYHNGIIDLLFALIRVLSDGVGIVVIGSIVVAGIQYSTSQGDPTASAAAITRIRTSLIALLIFIFAYALLNYVIPVGFFSS